MNARSVFPPGNHLVFCVPLLLASGCAGMLGEATDQPLDEYVESREKETGETLTIRLNEFAVRFSAVTESAADEIRGLSEDPRVRRDALLWKVEAIPLCHIACFRPNPLGGVMDVWTLCVQLHDYFAGGDGKELFGEHQAIAVRASESLVRAADALGKAAFGAKGEGNAAPRRVLSAESYEEVAAMIRTIAGELPLHRPISSRLAPNERFARYGDAAKGALGTLAALQSQLRRVERRMHIYVEHLPKQARWQGQLLAEDVLQTPAIAQAAASLADVDTQSKSVASSLDGVKSVIQQQVALVLQTIAAERKTLIDNVATQRVEALKAVTQERIAILDAVRTQMADAVSAVETTLARTVTKVFSEADRRMRRLLWWAVPAAAAAFALLVWAVGRRRTFRVETSGEPPTSKPGR